MLIPENPSPSLLKRSGEQVENILTDHCRKIKLEPLIVSCYFKLVSFFNIKNDEAFRNKLEIRLSFFSPVLKNNI